MAAPPFLPYAEYRRLSERQRGLLACIVCRRLGFDVSKMAPRELTEAEVESVTPEELAAAFERYPTKPEERR